MRYVNHALCVSGHELPFGASSRRVRAELRLLYDVMEGEELRHSYLAEARSLDRNFGDLEGG